MNLKDMRDELSDYGFQDVTITRLNAMLNDVYHEIHSLEDFPFLEKQTSLSWTAGSANANLPSDFDTLMTLTVDSISQPLQPLRLDDFQKRFTGLITQTGPPVYYYFIGDKVAQVWPVPDANYTATLNYIAVPTDMSADTDTPIFPAKFHRIVVLGALRELYLMENDPVMAGYFDSRFTQRLQEMRNDVWFRQVDRPDRVYDLFGQDDYYIF